MNGSKNRSCHFLILSMALMLLVTLMPLLVGCSRIAGKDKAEFEYEAQVIAFEGIKQASSLQNAKGEISISELRMLPKVKLSISLPEEGVLEELEGPSLKDIIGHLGGNISEYAGIGVAGKDGNFILLTKEQIDAGEGMIMAHSRDGEPRLDDADGPAIFAGSNKQTQFRMAMVERIVLYEYIPERIIRSLWVFSGLTEGTELKHYDYKGSEDASIELSSIFSKLEGIENRMNGLFAFTIKSADGQSKEQAINHKKSQYYIKVEGEDAPANLSPFIKPGNNLKNISWIITGRHALMFPESLAAYMEQVPVKNGTIGIPLPQILKEAGLNFNSGDTFDILGARGEKISVEKEELGKGFLVANGAGSAGIVWVEAAGYPDLEKLICIDVISPSGVKGPPGGLAGARQDEEDEEDYPGSKRPKPDSVFSIIGEESGNSRYFSLDDLMRFEYASAKGRVYISQIFSVLDNYPNKRFMVAKGADLELLMKMMNLGSQGRVFRIETEEGYFLDITREQLFGKRFYYPGLLKNRSSGAVRVKPMIAWACKPGSQNIEDSEGCKLRLIIGQSGLYDPNGIVAIQNVKTIKVINKVPERWEEPEVDLKDGKLVIAHDSMDRVKLYYTLDGSTPNFSSPVYNPGTSYFQTDSDASISITDKNNGRLKVKAVGYGKEDSRTVEFEFEF